MTYTCTDAFDTFMAAARALPDFDHDAEAALDDDDVDGATELALEAFAAQAKRAVNVVVYISGGNVQGVATDRDADRVKVAIVDYDNGAGVAPEDREKWGVHQFDDGAASVGVQSPDIDPEGVADVMRKAGA